MRKTLALLFALSLFAVPAFAFEAPAQPAACEAALAADAGSDAGDALPALELDRATESQQVNDCKGGGGGRCICPQVYAPVCGCDGNTYVNSCYASCKVKSWTSGSCEGGDIL